MKEYQGEKAIISLTSWKARINTVGKTIYSLLKQCPGFHIVLVLSEEEFPQKEKELPEDLMILSKYFEILWVYKNYKSFKKVLFTMDKYREVPVISADDGCIYIKNYAEQLFAYWLKNPEKIVSYVLFKKFDITFGGGGYGILFPPACFTNVEHFLTDEILETNHDDAFIGVLAEHFNKEFVCINRYGQYPEPYKNIGKCEKVGMASTKKFNDKSIPKIKAILNSIK